MTDEERARDIMKRFNGGYLNEEELEHSIALALAAVREECAKVADTCNECRIPICSKSIAKAIRTGP